MARIKEYKGKNKTTYQITIYKGYKFDKNGKIKQVKETKTYTLEEMGISAYSDKGNLRTEKKILEDVQSYADRLERKNSAISLIKGKKTSFREFYRESWIPYAESHFESSTYDPYKSHIESKFLPEIGEIALPDITVEKLNKIYGRWSKGGRLDGKEGGYSKVSIITYNKILSSVFELAINYEYIEKNPCKKVQMPKCSDETKIKCLDEEQAGIFLDMLENPSPCVVTAFYKNWGKSKTTVYDFRARKVSDMQYNTYKMLFRLGLFSGCRIGEMLALTWEDVKIDEETKKGVININKALAYSKTEGAYIKAPKTDTSNREVFIPKSEYELLMKLKKEQQEHMLNLGSSWKGYRNLDELDKNWVFATYDGLHLNKSSSNRILSRLIKNYNYEADENKKLPQITVHCLRHTHATLLIKEKTDIKTVSARLGHKQIATTLNIYAHLLKKSNAEACSVVEKVLNANAQ